MTAVFTPDAVQTSASDTMLATVEDQRFDIQVTAFVPEDHIPGPLGYPWDFGGDGAIPDAPSLAGFTRERSSYRLRENVSLMMNPLRSLSGEEFGTARRLVGQTRAYDPASSYSGNPALLTAQAKGDTVKGQGMMMDFATASTDGLTVTVTRTSVAGVQAHLVGSVNNPLISGSPAIDWDVTISIDTSNPLSPSYHIVGDHDGYPAYDIFIDDKLVYAHDPRLAGETIASLFPPSEHHIDESDSLP